MPTPLILIHERRPRWVPELQRQFYSQGVEIRACATLRDLESRLAAAPHAVCLLDLGSRTLEYVQTLRRLNTCSRLPTIIVAAPREFREMEWALRELGVVVFLEEPIPGDDMAACCRRQFQQDFARSGRSS